MIDADGILHDFRLPCGIPSASIIYTDTYENDLEPGCRTDPHGSRIHRHSGETGAHPKSSARFDCWRSGQAPDCSGRYDARFPGGAPAAHGSKPVTLVDTSVWVNHLRHGDARLAQLLTDNGAGLHPFVQGEIAAGNLK